MTLHSLPVPDCTGRYYNYDNTKEKVTLHSLPVPDCTGRYYNYDTADEKMSLHSLPTHSNYNMIILRKKSHSFAFPPWPDHYNMIILEKNVTLRSLPRTAQVVTI